MNIEVIMGKKAKDLNVNEKKGMGSKDHWQIDVSKSIFPENKQDSATAFFAMSGSKRPQPHVKVNECDH